MPPGSCPIRPRSLEPVTGRADGRVRAAGYSLVELLVVVAAASIVGTLAVQGGQRYLTAARSADAKRTVTAIARAAAASYERGVPPRALCTDSTAVPPTMALVAARSYQPSAAAGSDFQTGSDTGGWRCLAFSTDQPLWHQVSYRLDQSSDWSARLTEPYFVARAQGDLDGDGIYARFSCGGRVDGGLVVVEPQVWAENETE